MAMGIVSDNDFNSELSKVGVNQNKLVDPTSHDAVIIDLERGRGIGNLQVPEGLRKVIGDESITSGRASALDLANNFGISPSSVSAYNQGAHSTSSYSDRPDVSHITTAKLKIATKARNRLVLALNSLTQEKIEAAKVKDIAGVAKDMSAIIRNMEPEHPTNTNLNGPTFIFYSPQFRSEQSFEVIHVKE
jgi:hypothetical protein